MSTNTFTVEFPKVVADRIRALGKLNRKDPDPAKVIRTIVRDALTRAGAIRVNQGTSPITSADPAKE